MSTMTELDLQLGSLTNSPASLPHVLSVSLPRGTLQCEVNALDAIGCAVNYVRLSLNDQDRWPLAEMRSLAENLCKHLRYLVEPLQVIEVDTDDPLVQARSQPPTQDSQRNVCYYELLVAPQTLSLVRFSAPRGEPRTRMPMQLTREILRRLVQDIASAV